MQIYRPYLLGDILRRAPGRAASIDGTFRLIHRTKTDGTVLVIILGDEHTIVAYYVLRSESWAELRPALELLRDRLEQLDSIFENETALHDLEAWFGDRCCERKPHVTHFGHAQIPCLMSNRHTERMINAQRVIERNIVLWTYSQM